MDVPSFYEAKMLEQQQRHLKYHDTAYNLEPNVKESPGGLRDLHTVLWIARAAGLGRGWRDLAQAGLITMQEARTVSRQERLIGALRVRLHYLAGRREDRLVFDLQNALAHELGLADTPARRASEQLMQRYYRAAKMVRQVNVILLQNLHARLFPIPTEPVAIDGDFLAIDELLHVRDEALFERRPAAMLDAFLTMQRHPELKGMSARTLRSLWRNRHRVDARFRRDPANRARFMALLREPRGITHELRRMNLYGILGQVVPAFGRIVGQMQHDLFHVYTVDEHILMVIRNLRRFTESQHGHEYPLCSRLIGDFERKEVLYLAGLFHDIAKGRGGDHSTLGAAEARRFCRAHGLPAEDVDLVGWLVAQHLTHVLDGAKAGPVQSERRGGVRGTRRHRAAARRAVPPHGGRHPRHEPQGLERLEGAVARGPLSRDARAARRNRGRRHARRQPARPPARSAAAAPPLRGRGRRRARALGAARQRLFPAAFRRRDRLARAPPSLAHGRVPHRSSRRGCRGRKPGCRSRSTCPTRRTCSRGSAAFSGAGDCRSSKPRSTRRGTATRSTRSRCTIRRIPTRRIAMPSRSSNSSWRGC